MYKLYAPNNYGTQPCNYFLASTSDLKKICNGCGSKKSPKWMTKFLDKLCGVDLTPACDIHDWMYQYGVNYEDKAYADNIFHNNMNAIIDDGTWVLKFIRRRIADEFYLAVKEFGNDAFWSNKNK